MSTTVFWLGIGFAGQAFFTARFLLQWMASERRRRSVVPAAFWWFSILGGLTLLAYAIHRRDPVIIVGQAMGLVVYVRNLMLLARGRRRRSGLPRWKPRLERVAKRLRRGQAVVSKRAPADVESHG